MGRLWILCAGLLGVAGALLGQTATVDGMVKDTSDAIVVGARLTITNLETGLRREAVTNEAGDFTSAFVVQPQYTYGNSGRNILFGPGLRNIDLSIGKSFPLGERRRLQFRAESFNFTNTPSFGLPNRNITALGVGQITSAGDPRLLQFGLKFIM